MANFQCIAKQALYIVVVLTPVIGAICYENHRLHESEVQNWNAKFATPPTPEAELSHKDAEAIANAIAVIKKNQTIGADPWTNLSPLQVRLVCGDAPISLFYLTHKGVAPVYFDKDRNGIIFSFSEDNKCYTDPKPLSAVSQELQSLSKKFHLKESKYISGVYGLDSHHRNEMIEKKLLP